MERSSTPVHLQQVSVTHHQITEHLARQLHFLTDSDQRYIIIQLNVCERAYENGEPKLAPLIVSWNFKSCQNLLLLWKSRTAAANEPCLHERIHGYRTGKPVWARSAIARIANAGDDCGSTKGAEQSAFMNGDACVSRHVSLLWKCWQAVMENACLSKESHRHSQHTYKKQI